MEQSVEGKSAIGVPHELGSGEVLKGPLVEVGMEARGKNQTLIPAVRSSIA